MRLILLEDEGALYAVRLDAVERILAPDEAAPPGAKQAELRSLLGFPANAEESGPAARHRVLIMGGTVALAGGRPLATITLSPERILPLPGYMFAVPRQPFRGAFDATALPDRISRSPGTTPAPVGLVLHEEVLMEPQEAAPGPDCALLKPAKRPAGPEAAREGRMPHILVLTAGGSQVGVPLTAARLVLAAQRVTAVGRARSHVAGLIVHDGKAIPVYHLARLVSEAAPARDARSQIVVLEEEGALAGFLVDGVQALRHAEAAPPLVVQGQDLMRAAGAGTARGSVTQAARAAEGE